jgi:hypothetical protein
LPLETACAALAKGCCLELRYRGENLCVDVHIVGYGADHEPLLHAWQRVGFTSGGWRTLQLKDARSPDISGYISEAPRPGYRPDPAIVEIVCQI